MEDDDWKIDHDVNVTAKSESNRYDIDDDEEEEAHIRDGDGGGEEEETNLEGPELAARNLGFPPDNMNDLERSLLSELLPFQKNYLKVRNTILYLWYRDPTTYLRINQVEQELKNSNYAQLIRIVHCFLEQYGCINCGVLSLSERVKSPHLKNSQKKKIIVIGSGMSGICTAAQLKSFGHDVIVIEGRDRLGGRVNSSSDFGGAVDLGASIITGDIGNPMWTLIRQTQTRTHVIMPNCMLYNVDGSRVDKGVDDKMERTFNWVLHQTSCMRVALTKNEDANAEDLEDIKYTPPILDTQTLFNYSLGDAMQRVCDEAHLYFNPQEKSLYNWHIANLEYGCASVLHKISLPYWDQDDPYAFDGDHCMLPDGYSALLGKLANNAMLDIKYNHCVQKVEYSDNSAKVIAILSQPNQTESQQIVFEADAVVVTASLGVLKSGLIEFDPPLPKHKQESIQRLGFGNLNKIVLRFADVFWNDEDMFGCLRDDDYLRGECYMFWNIHRVTQEPVLVALAAGAASFEIEKRDGKEAVDIAMSILKKIFGDKVTEPVHTHVTSWSSDKFARGSYSFVHTGANAKDYDNIAECVGNTLFFAGEATYKYLPATVPGAYASGLRCAGDVDRINAKRSWEPISKLLSSFGSFDFATSITDDSQYSHAREEWLRSLKEHSNRHRRGFRQAPLSIPITGVVSTQSAFEEQKRSEAKKRLEQLTTMLISGITPVIKGNYDRPSFSQTTSQSVTKMLRPPPLEVQPVRSKQEEVNPDLPTFKSFEELDSHSNINNKNNGKHNSQNRKRKHENAASSSSDKHKSKHKSNNSDNKQITSQTNESETRDKFLALVRSSYKSVTIQLNVQIEKEQAKTIIKKSLDKIQQDWSSKPRNVPVDDWLNSKRKKSVLDLVKKYVERSNQSIGAPPTKNNGVNNNHYTTITTSTTYGSHETFNYNNTNNNTISSSNNNNITNNNINNVVARVANSEEYDMDL